MYRHFIEKNPTLVSLILFLVLYYAILVGKPDFLYNSDGSLRQFGVGYRKKTIFPIWLMSLILGILCYLFVIVYTTKYA
jgi:uncharacterized membrane protein YozB (DUF420 family)